MKQIISFSLLLMSALFIMQSCKKASADAPASNTLAVETLRASVSVASPYIFNAGSFGSVSIARQAGHFAISQTETSDGVPVYKYVPENGYAGEDEVELMGTKTTYSSGGGGCNGGGGGGYTSTHTSRIIIKFTVTK